MSITKAERDIALDTIIELALRAGIHIIDWVSIDTIKEEYDWIGLTDEQAERVLALINWDAYYDANTDDARDHVLDEAVRRAGLMPKETTFPFLMAFGD